MEEPKLFERKRRVYYRLRADGTIIGPAHTRGYLHLMVASRRSDAYYLAKWRERCPEDKDRDTSSGFWDYRL